MAVRVPDAVFRLLTKLGMVAKPAAQIEIAKLGQNEDKPKKGEAMGPEGMLLHGLGFNVKDGKQQAKNLAEKANVDRFLQDPEARAEKSEHAFGFVPEQKDGPSAKKEERSPGGLERQEPREELAKETRRGADEARFAAAEDPRAQKEARETREKTPEQEQREKHDESQGRGGGGGSGRGQEGEESDERGRGDRESFVFDEADRCHGMIADGSRCLRKPLSGRPYCLEHLRP